MLDVLLCHLVIESSEAPLCLCAENGCMYSFCGGDILVMQIMFYVDMLNTKVVYNFLILLLLKFHDFWPVGLGVIDLRSCYQVLHVLWTEMPSWCCLTLLDVESS